MAPPTQGLGPLWDEEAARERLAALCGGELPASDPRVTTILAFADGVPLAVESAARAINALGLETTSITVARTVVGEGALHDALERIWNAEPALHGLLTNLSSWERSIRASLVVDSESFSIAAVERAAALDLLRTLRPAEGEHELALVRPVLAFVRSKSPPTEAARRAHAERVAELASELVTQFEMTGDLEPLVHAKADFAALVCRGAIERELVPAALGAMRGLMPVMCFRHADGPTIEAMQQLVRVARNEPTTVALGHAMLALGLAERASGASDAAQDLLTAALTIAHTHDDRALEGRAERARGAMLIDAGRLDEAVTSLRRAVEASEEGGDDVHRSLALQWLALGLGRAGELHQAIEALRESIEIHRGYGNARMVLYEQSMLGSFYARLGDLRRGRIAIEEAIGLAKRLADRGALGFAQASLAYTLIAERALARAVGEATAAEHVFVELGQDALVAYCRGVRGIASLLEGETDLALELLEHAATHAKLTERPLFSAYLATIEARDGLVGQARARAARAARAVDGQEAFFRDAITILARAVEWLLDGSAAPASDGRSVDVRIAQLWLERLEVPFDRRRSQPAPSTWSIRTDGTAFAKLGVVTRIAERPVMRRLVRTLAEHRASHPGESVPVDRLVASVWPGERMLERSARTRLHAVVMRLRQLGLREVLIQADGGYRFDPIETEVSDSFEETGP